jgi:hypothetical protein
LLRVSDITLASLRTDLSFGRVKAIRRHVVSFASRPADVAFGHDWTKRTAPGLLSPRPNRGPYAASSRIYLRSYRYRHSAPGVLLLRTKSGPLRRVKRTLSSVISGPTQRPRRAFTQAKSGPLRRVKRTLSLVTTISDRRGTCALNAARAHAVTYPAEGHLEDYAPYIKRGGSIASSVLRKHTQKGKILDAKSWGKT